MFSPTTPTDSPTCIPQMISWFRREEDRSFLAVSPRKLTSLRARAVRREILTWRHDILVNGGSSCSAASCSIHQEGEELVEGPSLADQENQLVEPARRFWCWIPSRSTSSSTTCTAGERTREVWKAVKR